MKKIFTLLCTVLFASGLFAATEPAWYNDVTSISANGQYYIYSVNGKAFMQAGQAQVKSITTSNYTSASTFKFTIANPSEGTVKSGNYYLKCYREVSGTTSGPINTKTENGTDIIFTSMNNGEYWNIHGHYNVFGERYPALYYKNDEYNAYLSGSGLIWSTTKDTQTATEYRWYLVSQAQLDRHFAIYFFDAYKETLNIAQYENHVPAAYYTALQTAYNKTFDVTNAAHTTEVVNAAKTELESLYNGALAIQTAYETAKGTINALEAVEDKGEDYAEVTAGITAARTAIEAAMSVDALNAAVSAPALKGIDPITFNVTTFIAGKDLGTPASTTAGRTITYDAADKTIINAAGLPIYKGTTKLTATAAATNDYYKFVRSANVTVNAEDTEAEETKTITYGDNESWHGKDLSVYTVGQHTLIFDTLNVYGGAHKITLTLTVNKIEMLNVPVELSFCEGGSQFYRGVEYKTAGTYPVNATGAIRDTVYNVTVTILQPTTGTDTKTITFGDDAEWNGIALKDSTVGVHTVTYVTENAAGCDSTVTLTLTVNKLETLNVPVELSFCEGGSEFYRGVEYKTAGTYPVNATGAVRDTVYNVTVTVLQPTFGTDAKTIVYGAEESWNGIALKDSTVGIHYVVYETTNTAGCDSIITLTLTVEKMSAFEAEKELEFCEGDSVEYRGVWYSTAGEYPVLVEDDVRDTLINVIVTVHEKAYAEVERTVLAGDVLTLPEGEWTIDNQVVSGTYETLRGDTLGLELYQYDETEFGCKSVVKLIVTVTPNYEAIETVLVDEQAEKFFQNGAIYIRRGEKEYSVDGRLVK